MRRRGCRGSETVELMAVMPILVLVFLAALQLVVLARQQFQAESDARLLVRAAALCPATTSASLATIDPAAGAGARVMILSERAPLIGISVSLPPRALLPGVALPSPRASAVMRHEPC